MKTPNRYNRYLRGALLGGLLLLTAVLLAAPVLANDIYQVEMHAVIHRDGSATITETWNIKMDNASNTEFYVAKHHLDNMRIRDLLVEELLEDGTAMPFETLGSWNADATRSQKAGKAGTVRAKGGYEICWGFGELGRHTYRVTYTITGIVKGYDGGDIMSFNFLSDAAGGASSLDIHLSAEDFALEYPETRVWVFGYEAQSDFVDGGILVLGQGRFAESDYAAIMLAFEPGLLSPEDQREETAQEIIDLNMEGSVWESGGSSSGGIFRIVSVLGPASLILFQPFFLVILFFILFRVLRKRGSGPSRAQVTKLMRDVDYCRELPFGGSLEATYNRLHTLGQAKDGSIIGCHMLHWVRSGQVEIVQEEVGLIRKRQEDALRLHPETREMVGLEHRLYEMLQAAAGADQVLQSKEFERWARKHYSRVDTWLSDARSRGQRELDAMGAYHSVPVKRLFGLINTTQRTITPLGEELTGKMFGFLRYLQEFTLINEREAREVELWDQYLIFAQLFGIADSVAKQFKTLYPDYFSRPDMGGAYGHSTGDILIATAISTSFTRSMYSGYQSGKSAASSSSGGGGGSSSSGGGGGSSGGGGAGGR